MKLLGFIFVALVLVGLGITAAKLGWFDYMVNWVSSWGK